MRALATMGSLRTGGTRQRDPQPHPATVQVYSAHCHVEKDLSWSAHKGYFHCHSDVCEITSTLYVYSVMRMNDRINSHSPILVKGLMIEELNKQTG